MGLNIKNKRVHDLAREAARITGKSQTAAVELALERLLQEHQVDPHGMEVARTVELVRTIAIEYSQDQGSADRPIMAVEDLYDDAGLPR